MQHYPIFLSVKGRQIALVGGGEAALAKLRLLLKTEAQITVYAPAPHSDIQRLAADGKLRLEQRHFDYGDAMGCALVYAATEDALEDARIVTIAHDDHVLVNVVDNLEASDFITPAIVDRDPVTIAIGTEGAAPVLARAIKTDLEERLPSNLGLLARLGKSFRGAADILPMGAKRRAFWSDYYFNTGPRAAEASGAIGAQNALETTLDRHLLVNTTQGHVDLIGAGPGDPELLTLKARKALDTADVVIHDRDVAPEILELARREAMVIEARGDVTDLIATHVGNGLHVVHLTLAPRDADLRALTAAGLSARIIPGVAVPSARPAIPLFDVIRRTAKTTSQTRKEVA